MHLGQFELALKDSERCVEIAPDFVKAHFRKGKALLGLEQYSEAVEALTTALKLKKNNKEIRDALQHAILKKKDRGNNILPSSFQKMDAFEVLQSLENQNLFPKAAHLLTHLFNLFKRYYSRDIDTHSRLELLGGDADEVGAQLHSWAIHVDLNMLMEVSGIPQLLFETELIADHVKNPPDTGNNDGDPMSVDNTYEDLSCYQFSFFVSTTLARLVLQGHSKFGLRALKRLIVLDSNKMVRDSVGSPLTLATLQVSGHGGWGLPSMPALRHLFVHYGGLRCVAFDSKDDAVFRVMCAEILHQVTTSEWKKQSTNILEIVLANFVLPSLDGNEKDIQSKAIDVFARIYSLPDVRDTSFEEWAKHPEKEEFAIFCHVITQKNKLLLKREKSRKNGAMVLGEIERGEKLARLWINLPPRERTIKQLG